jgi:branched-subunit amino acid transport protein
MDSLTIHTGYLLIVLGMGLVTYLPRWFPLFFLARRNLPQWLIDWLDLIPAAILSALLVPELITVARPATWSCGGRSFGWPCRPLFLR